MHAQRALLPSQPLPPQQMSPRPLQLQRLWLLLGHLLLPRPLSQLLTPQRLLLQYRLPCPRPMPPLPLRLLLQQSQRQQPRLTPQEQSPLPLLSQQLRLRQMRLQPQLLPLQSQLPMSVLLRRVLVCNQVRSALCVRGLGLYVCHAWRQPETPDVIGRMFPCLVHEYNATYPFCDTSYARRTCNPAYQGADQRCRQCHCCCCSWQCHCRCSPCAACRHSGRQQRHSCGASQRSSSSQHHSPSDSSSSSSSQCHCACTCSGYQQQHIIYQQQHCCQEHKQQLSQLQLAFHFIFPVILIKLFTILFLQLLIQLLLKLVSERRLLRQASFSFGLLPGSLRSGSMPQHNEICRVLKE